MKFAHRTLLMMAAVTLGEVMTISPAPSQTPRSEAPQPMPEERQSPPAPPDDTAGPQQGASTAPSGSLSDELSRSGGEVQPPAPGAQGEVPPPKRGTRD